MKNIILFLLTFFVLNVVFSQQCDSFNEKEIHKIYKSIKKYKTDKGRLVGSERYLLGSCITSTQLYQLALTFDEDPMRGQFLKKYVYSITDYEKIAVVFGSFDRMSESIKYLRRITPDNLS